MRERPVNLDTILWSPELQETLTKEIAKADSFESLIKVFLYTGIIKGTPDSNGNRRTYSGAEIVLLITSYLKGRVKEPNHNLRALENLTRECGLRQKAVDLHIAEFPEDK